MELSYPKTDYLLDATLETLHKESAAWLKELDFWADELSFFYKLLHSHRLSGAFPSAEMAGIDKALISLSAENIETLRIRLRGHERQLADLFKPASSEEEQSYRAAHRMLYADMYKLHSDIRTFKQKLFLFVGDQM
jgi:hypothetical protein